MACQGCINRQRKLVEKLCKSPDGWLCRKAKQRLERMLGDASSDKMARPEGASNTTPASDHND
jgi:hypothetical protein